MAPGARLASCCDGVGGAFVFPVPSSKTLLGVKKRLRPPIQPPPVPRFAVVQPPAVLLNGTSWAKLPLVSTFGPSCAKTLAKLGVTYTGTAPGSPDLAVRITARPDDESKTRCPVASNQSACPPAVPYLTCSIAGTAVMVVVSLSWASR